MTLGQRIQDGRTKLGLSQENLGDRLWVSRQAVSKWEADAAVPDTDKLIALSKLFGMTLNELLQVEPPLSETEAPGSGKEPETVPPSTSGLQPRPFFRFLSIAAGILLFALTAAVIALSIQNRRLEGRIGELETQLEALSTSVGNLDPSAPLVAGFDFHVAATGRSSNTLEYRFDLIPAQVPDGLAVSFDVTGGNPVNTYTVEAQQEGSHFAMSGSLAAPGSWKAGDITITALLTDATGGAYTACLARVTSLEDNGYAWEPLWEK